MNEELLGGLVGIAVTLVSVALAILFKKKVITKEQVEDSRDLVFDTTKMAREELLKIFEASDDIVDFIQKNFHEGDSFGQELMEYIEKLKKDKNVIDIVPEDKKF